MPRERVYLVHPFAIYGTPLAEKFKDVLRGKYDLVYPFETVGLGTQPEIADKDMQLIEECDRVVAFLPCEGLQSGWELCYAFMKGKKITIYIRPELVGPFINWMKERGAEVRLCSSESLFKY